jgi:hypothetical protein
MLISLLLRLVATIFVSRPPGISLGQCSPHARHAVRELERRHFRIQFAVANRPTPTRRNANWVKAPARMPDGFEGEWSCKP